MMRRAHRILFFLLIVFLPTQLGYHFWPDSAMVLGRRIDYLSPTIYFTDIIIISILMCWLVEVVMRMRNNEYRIMKRATFGYSIWYLVYSVIILMFIGINIYRAQSIPVAMYAWAKIFEYIFLGAYIVWNKPSWRYTVTGVSIAVIYASCIGIAQYVVQHSVGGLLWWLGERRFFADTPGIAQISLCAFWQNSCVLQLRSYSVFPHPNVFGGFLAISLPLLMHQASNVRGVEQIRLQEKYFLWVGVALGIIALVVTYSRSAWVVAVIGICIVWVIDQAMWVRKHRMLMIIGGVAIGVAVFIGFIRAPIQDESFIVRQQLNRAAIQIWQQSPWVGVGAGNFLVSLPLHLVSREIYFLQPVHNIYFLLLSEIGIAGICLIIFLLYLLNHEVRIMNHTYRFAIIHASFVMILLLGLVDHYFLTLQQGQLLFVIVSGFAFARNHVLQ